MPRLYCALARGAADPTTSPYDDRPNNLPIDEVHQEIAVLSEDDEWTRILGKGAPPDERKITAEVSDLRVDHRLALYYSR
jgi:hypothetical protein